jgi:NAD(P)H dehydrogenase (quinone)
MHALWVWAHPSPTSLNAHLSRVGIDALRAEGWEVVESDLYREGWDPVLRREGGPDVRGAQDRLRAADLVVLQFPLWWYGMPAIMKGWVDRVFESGFAFDVVDPGAGRARKYGDGGLAGRRALAVVTAGDRPGSLEPRGISGSIEDVLWPLLHGTFWYTGMAALRPHLVTQARDVSPGRLLKIEAELRDRLGGVGHEAPIPYLPMTDAHYDHSIRLHPDVAPQRTGNDAHLATG